MPMEGSGSVPGTAVTKQRSAPGAGWGGVWQGSARLWVTGSSPRLGNLVRQVLLSLE